MVWSPQCKPLCLKGEQSLPPLVLHKTRGRSSAGCGLLSLEGLATGNAVLFSSSPFDPSTSSKYQKGGLDRYTGSPQFSLVPGGNPSCRGGPVAPTYGEGSVMAWLLRGRLREICFFCRCHCDHSGVQGGLEPFLRMVYHMWVNVPWMCHITLILSFLQPLLDPGHAVSIVSILAF